MRICVSGSAGFIAGYLVEELLSRGHTVIGLDNFSKYGEITRSYHDHPNYRFVRGDAKQVDLLERLLDGCDIMVAAAARIGGISYFHHFAYDLLAENERITAAAFDAALCAYRRSRLKRIVILSSSMVFESATVFPTPEGAELTSPPPRSSYGFQKLACEYFARAAWEQYQLPYTVVRSFNCVGIGEGRALDAPAILSGNVKLAMSHVLPDLVLKILRGQDPLHILGSGRQLRHFTYGGDVARGICLAIESDRAINQDFNISTATPTTVLEMAEFVWRKVNLDKPFRYVSDPPFPYDVQMRAPDVSKARELLGFEAATSLDEVIDQVIPWIDAQLKARPNVTGLLSVVIPIRNEADNIGPMLAGVADALTVPAEILLVYDHESDPTLPVIRSLTTPPQLQYRPIRNLLGAGPANALKAGFGAARGEAIIVMMADKSDDLRALRGMIDKFEAGYDLICGSRYMRGGEQIGGPWLKGKLSRLAGLSLHALGLPVHDATNSFKLYRTRSLRSLDLRSSGGFEINLEIIAKAWRLGWRMSEVPSRWVDRTSGRSNFKLIRWLPRYLKWYCYAVAAPLLRMLKGPQAEYRTP